MIVCPECKNPLTGVTEHKLTAASQDVDIDPTTGEIDSDSWEETKIYYESEFISYYTSSCCDRLLPPASVRAIGLGDVDKRARRTIPPHSEQAGS